MTTILISLGDSYDSLTSEMQQALIDQGYTVSARPTNADFGLASDNPHLWRSLPAVIKAAETTQGHAFASDCYGQTSKIITIPDDVNWRIATNHMDREFVEEVHRTWV